LGFGSTVALLSGVLGCEGGLATAADASAASDTGAEARAAADADVGLEAGPGAACHSVSVLPACPAAASAPCSTGACGLASLPNGEACSLPACGMAIDPCPGANLFLPDRVDSYGCTCNNGRWSCALCSLGEGLCAELDAGATLDATPCSPVLPSNYDQSCDADTDCVGVGEVPQCPAAACDGCMTEAINKTVLAQYLADLSRAFASEPPGEACNCPCGGVAVCRGGTCQEGYCAPPSTDTLPACADAGGICAYTANTTCGAMGPPDSCAYSDEFCCTN
jgi:hypothetical protein